MNFGFRILDVIRQAADLPKYEMLFCEFGSCIVVLLYWSTVQVSSRDLDTNSSTGGSPEGRGSLLQDSRVCSPPRQQSGAAELGRASPEVHWNGGLCDISGLGDPSAGWRMTIVNRKYTIPPTRLPTYPPTIVSLPQIIPIQWKTQKKPNWKWKA